jgi:TPR repeat protein
MRAVSLEPREASHRLRAAMVFARLKQFEQADAQARMAGTLAATDREREMAREFSSTIERARPSASPTTSAPAATAAGMSTSAPPSDGTALNTACQAGSDEACAKLLPAAELACEEKNANACGFAARIFEGGRGVARNRDRAVHYYQRACERGAVEACTQLGVLLAAGGAPADVTRARELLTRSCESKSVRACELLKSLPR